MAEMREDAIKEDPEKLCMPVSATMSLPTNTATGQTSSGRKFIRLSDIPSSSYTEPTILDPSPSSSTYIPPLSVAQQPISSPTRLKFPVRRVRHVRPSPYPLEPPKMVVLMRDKCDQTAAETLGQAIKRRKTELGEYLVMKNKLLTAEKRAEEMERKWQHEVIMAENRRCYLETKFEKDKRQVEEDWKAKKLGWTKADAEKQVITELGDLKRRIEAQERDKELLKKKLDTLKIELLKLSDIKFEERTPLKALVQEGRKDDVDEKMRRIVNYMSEQFMYDTGNVQFTWCIRRLLEHMDKKEGVSFKLGLSSSWTRDWMTQHSINNEKLTDMREELDKFFGWPFLPSTNQLFDECKKRCDKTSE